MTIDELIKMCEKRWDCYVGPTGVRATDDALYVQVAMCGKPLDKVIDAMWVEMVERFPIGKLAWRLPDKIQMKFESGTWVVRTRAAAVAA